MNNDSAVVLLSGGQDSATCLYWAEHNFKRVVALSFDYGQRHRTELEAAAVLCEEVGISQKILKVTIPSLSSLTDDSQSVSAPHIDNANLPSSFLPGRNLIFLSLAAAWAYGEKLFNLVTGVCQTDYSGYPDCRRQFVCAAELAIGLAMDAPFVIHAPLMFKSKAQTWFLAKSLGVLNRIKDSSVTCYEGNDKQNEWGKGCGECPSCKLRARGWDEAKEKGWV